MVNSLQQYLKGIKGRLPFEIVICKEEKRRR